MSHPKRVMIVATHPIMSDGLRLVFQGEPDMEMVCEARDLEQVLRDFESCYPDLVLVDLQLPEGEGLRAVRALRKLSPSLPMVVLTMYPGQAVAIKCRGVRLLVADTTDLIPGIHREAVCLHRRGGSISLVDNRLVLLLTTLLVRA